MSDILLLLLPLLFVVFPFLTPPTAITWYVCGGLFSAIIVAIGTVFTALGSMAEAYFLYYYVYVVLLLFIIFTIDHHQHHTDWLCTILNILIWLTLGHMLSCLMLLYIDSYSILVEQVMFYALGLICLGIWYRTKPTIRENNSIRCKNHLYNLHPFRWVMVKFLPLMAIACCALSIVHYAKVEEIIYPKYYTDINSNLTVSQAISMSLDQVPNYSYFIWCDGVSLIVLNPYKLYAVRSHPEKVCKRLCFITVYFLNACILTAVHCIQYTHDRTLYKILLTKMVHPATMLFPHQMMLNTVLNKALPHIIRLCAVALGLLFGLLLERPLKKLFKLVFQEKIFYG